MSRISFLPPRAAHVRIPIRIGSWPSGLYFARLTARDGRVGFAPFVVRPSRLGQHRVLVVLPTYTWQAYNFRDDNHDGFGDTWYAGWRQNWARLNRPFLDRGVPGGFKTYDLHFLNWLARTNRGVDFFSDADLGSVRRATALRRAYDLIIFPGHHEYVTTHEYDLVQGFRDHGGNLMFLSANNFFWHIELHGDTMVRTAEWRDLGRPEAALVGVQFIGTDEGVHRAPWVVRHAEAARWLFAGTGLVDGSAFSRAGIEIDHTASSSPRDIHVLADIRSLFGSSRFTAQMTYYRARSGAQVFAAGAFTLGGFALQPKISTMLDNLWQRMAGTG